MFNRCTRRVYYEHKYDRLLAKTLSLSLLLMLTLFYIAVVEPNPNPNLFHSRILRFVARIQVKLTSYIFRIIANDNIVEKEKIGLSTIHHPDLYLHHIKDLQSTSQICFTAPSATINIRCGTPGAHPYSQ